MSIFHLLKQQEKEWKTRLAFKNKLKQLSMALFQGGSFTGTLNKLIQQQQHQK